MKPLAEMSHDELKRELAGAIVDEATADYIDQLSEWRRAREAARERQEAVIREIEARFGRKLESADV